MLNSFLPIQEEFDVELYNFKLMTGSAGDAAHDIMHTQAILANASIKEGENKGMPIPLKCVWFNMRVEDNELFKIPKANGACYQPSIEDVGHKILVYAYPETDKEQQTMPLLENTGPIVMDPSVSEKV